MLIAWLRVAKHDNVPAVNRRLACPVIRRKDAHTDVVLKHVAVPLGA